MSHRRCYFVVHATNMLRSFFPLQTVRTGMLPYVFERDASGRDGHAKGKVELPPPHLAIWQKHDGRSRAGERWSHERKFQDFRARPTHAHSSVGKKTRVAPFRGKTATKHATRLPMPKRSATTLLINISNPIWRGGRGRRGRPLATQRDSSQNQ